MVEKLNVISIFVVTLLLLNSKEVDSGNPDAKRLYDDLLSNYNKLVRPVANVTETVTVHLKLKLSQLIAVVSIFSKKVFFQIFLPNTIIYSLNNYSHNFLTTTNLLLFSQPI